MHRLDLSGLLVLQILHAAEVPEVVHLPPVLVLDDLPVKVCLAVLVLLQESLGRPELFDVDHPGSPCRCRSFLCRQWRHRFSQRSLHLCRFLCQLFRSCHRCFTNRYSRSSSNRHFIPPSISSTCSAGLPVVVSRLPSSADSADSPYRHISRHRKDGLPAWYPHPPPYARHRPEQAVSLSCACRT